MKRSVLKMRWKKAGMIAGVSAILLLGGTGSAFAGWRQDSVGWWYDNEDGSYPANAWKHTGDAWYCFDENGYMRTGWIDNTYYCTESGAMATGWNQINGSWYYFRDDGAVARSQWVGDDWVDENGKWDAGAEKASVVSSNSATTVSRSHASKNETSETTDSNKEKNSSSVGNAAVSSVPETAKRTENASMQENGSGSVRAESSQLSISNHETISGSYEVGSSIPLTGTITSNYEIISVEIDLKVTYLGEKHYTKEYPTSGKTVNLEDLDLSYFDTSRLTWAGAGYCFTVKATDASGTTRELFEDYFKMAYLERLEYSLENHEEIPDMVTEGTNYQLNGVIQANYPITQIIVELKSTKTGASYGYEKVTPYTYTYDLAELAGGFDFSALEEGKYRYYVSAHIGSKIDTVIEKRFEVQAESSATVVVINGNFGTRDDGAGYVTNDSRDFNGRILADASSRISSKFKNSHPYVEFKWKKSDAIRYNHVYAHSEGIVTKVDKSAGVVMIDHGNGYVTTYKGLSKDAIYVRQGTGVDENTTIGEIPKNKKISVYLEDEDGNALDISDYLNSDF
ncbi:MAG: peptidoglycan DD-metalloendopeptidase family protein [Clostridiales bacterium]|nr:peptidoglycan DD-metalloendopeptidase family protein [Clostridiales bacterium]